jgi:hypothetical protein
MNLNCEYYKQAAQQASKKLKTPKKPENTMVSFSTYLHFVLKYIFVIIYSCIGSKKI